MSQSEVRCWPHISSSFWWQSGTASYVSTSHHRMWQGFSPLCWQKRRDHKLKVEKRLIIVDKVFPVFVTFHEIWHLTDVVILLGRGLCVPQTTCCFLSTCMYMCAHIYVSNCIAWGTILECKVCSILGSERDRYSIFMHCLATFEESNIHWGRTTTTLHTLEHRGRGVKLVQSVANVQLFSKLHPQNVN